MVGPDSGERLFVGKVVSLDGNIQAGGELNVCKVR